MARKPRSWNSRERIVCDLYNIQQRKIRISIKYCGLCAVAIIIFAGQILPANTISASLFTAQAPVGGSTTTIGLSGISTPSQGSIAGSGYSIAFSSVGGNEGVVQGSQGGAYALPVAGVSGSTPEYLTGGFGSVLTTNAALSGNYLSTGVGTITITFTTPQTSLALLWGSIDIGNSLTFNDTAGFVVTGSAVQAAAAGFVGNGYQGPGGSAYIVVNTSTPFTTIKATSSSVSFEFVGVAAADSPFVINPEPGSLLLSLSGMGLAGLGICYRRLRQSL